MKTIQKLQYHLIVLFCLSFLFYACSSEDNIKRLVAVEKGGVLLGMGDYNFPLGSYYLMTDVVAPDPLVKDGSFFLYPVPNVDMLLGYIIGAGVEIEEAWIFPENSCNGLFQVETPMKILIRVSGNQSGNSLEKLGFTSLSNSAFPSCDGIFSHYTFGKK